MCDEGKTCDVSEQAKLAQSIADEIGAIVISRGEGSDENHSAAIAAVTLMFAKCVASCDNPDHAAALVTKACSMACSLRGMLERHHAEREAA